MNAFKRHLREAKKEADAKVAAIVGFRYLLVAGVPERIKVTIIGELAYRETSRGTQTLKLGRLHKTRATCIAVAKPKAGWYARDGKIAPVKIMTDPKTGERTYFGKDGERVWGHRRYCLHVAKQGASLTARAGKRTAARCAEDSAQDGSNRRASANAARKARC